MLDKLRYALKIFIARSEANHYYFDKEIHCKNSARQEFYDKRIEQIRAEIELYEQFEGDPMEWKANGDSISECQECPHNEKCKRWNNYINRPARKRATWDRVMQVEHIIEYDEYGNRKYQGLNLKTGEQI